MELLKFNSSGQWTLEKSNYGPKGAGLYDPTVNAKRKATNVGELSDVGPNKSVKQYSSTPSGKSYRQQANQEGSSYNKINRKQPVKRYSSEELERYRKSKLNIAKNGQWSLE